MSQFGMKFIFYSVALGWGIFGNNLIAFLSLIKNTLYDEDRFEYLCSETGSHPQVVDAPALW